ncbi:TonB-dependent receptor [Puteibacter caeruleilacunae]|nr:TonB-dependent receptor [Puteibacter caeruleilacunae]
MRKIITSIVVLLGMLTVAFAQRESKINGIVFNSENGQALPGATIVEKGTQNGIVTDINGRFNLELKNGSGFIVVSFIGMETEEIPISNEEMRISLKPKLVNVDDVVVVAYGKQVRRAMTGSQSSLGAFEIKDQRVISAANLLQGTATGVHVINSIGQPGEHPDIRIRGISSVNASAAPLIVVDGIVFDGNLSNLSTSDIESINVLKDASSAALYGSRGANGVILITTKQGKQGEAIIQVNSSVGISKRAVSDYDVVSSADYMKLAWEALSNEGMDANEANPGSYASEELVSRLGYNPYGINQPVNENGELNDQAKLLWETDWVDQLTRDEAMHQQVDLSIQGGSEKTNYYVSGSYLSQDGMVIKSNFERFTGRVQVESNVRDWLKVGMRNNFSYSLQNYPEQSGSSLYNNISWARELPGIYPLYQRDADGELKFDQYNQPMYDFGVPVKGQAINDDRPVKSLSNLVATTRLDDYKRKRYYTSFNGYTDIKLCKHLTLHSNFATELYLYNISDYNNPENGPGEAVNGRVRKDKNTTTSWTWYNQLAYDRSFGDHKVGAMLTSEAYQYKLEYQTSQGTNFPFPGLKELDSAATVEKMSGSSDKSRLASWLGRFSYGYRDRYFVETSIRRDQSSRFGKDHRMGTFASVGAGWIISEEDFFPKNDWVQYLKLRGSYGELGNNDLQNSQGNSIYFPYLSTFSTGYDDLENPGVYLSSLANPSITWESMGILNIALDFSLLKDRIHGNIEWYQKTTSDMLFMRPLPPSVGVPSIAENVGEVRNSGVEVFLEGRIINRHDFQWTASLNMSWLNNEITELPQEEIIDDHFVLREGMSLYSFYLPKYEGVDPETGKALYKTIDDLDDAMYTDDYDAAKKVYSGSALPKFYGGFQNRIQYKGFDFGCLVNFSVGAKVLDTDYAGLMHGFSRMGYQVSSDIKQRWQKAGDVTDIPRLDISDGNVSLASNRFVFNNDYLRLRNITLGYTVNKRLLTPVKAINSLRLYVQADNVLTLSSHDGMDPEQGIEGLTNSRSTALKGYTFGVNIGF